MERRGSWSVVGGGSLGAEEEKAGQFRVKVSVSVSVSANVRWLLAGFGLLGEEGAAEQGRTGLDWARQDRTGWVDGWVDGRVGRSSVFGTLGCGPGGLQGGIRRYKRAKPGIH